MSKRNYRELCRKIVGPKTEAIYVHRDVLEAWIASETDEYNKAVYPCITVKGIPVFAREDVPINKMYALDRKIYNTDFYE